MGLTRLDYVVFTDHLLPLLQVNDLLRLRRVCNDLKNVTEEYIHIYKIATNRELVSNFYENDNENFQCNNLFNMGLPIRSRVRLSFKDTKEEINLYTKSAENFCSNLACHVTHLTISNLGIPFWSKKIIKFFEQFTNIRHLVLEGVRPWMGWGQDDEKPKEKAEIEIPSNFKNLQNLTIKNYCVWGDQTVPDGSLKFVVKLVETCLKNLKILSLPFDQFLWNVDSRSILELACFCLFSENNHLKICNVDGDFIELLLNPETRFPEMGTLAQMAIRLNERVVSIKNPKEKCFLLELPNLERIHFESTSEQCVMPEEVELCTRWSNLEEVIVCADFEDAHRRYAEAPELSRIWDFLFGVFLGENDSWWEKLTKLDISLCGFVGNVETYPSTRAIVGSCSRLKSIVIRYWEREHEDLAVLWDGLPLLEEVRFDHCTELGDEGFFGVSGEEPAFLKLKNLKVLELESIQVMKITDALFSEILKHMPLKEFILASDDLINKDDVVKWLKSLLGGKFAEEIERLCLDEVIWGGENGEQEFESLKRLFRSYSMI